MKATCVIISTIITFLFLSAPISELSLRANATILRNPALKMKGEDRAMNNRTYCYAAVHFSDEPRTVIGVSYHSGDTKSFMPLGGLGTGTIGMNSRGEFVNQSISNSYRPLPLDPQSCSIEIKSGRTGKWEPLSKWSKTYLAHFPIADYGCSRKGSSIKMELRAFSPFIPEDSRDSATPVALFRFRARNVGKNAARIAIRFQWNSPLAETDNGVTSSGNVDGYLRWNLGDIQAGEQRVAPVMFLAANSMRSLKALFRHPHGDITLDENGAFNWENTGQQCLHTTAGGCLSQHGFFLHYTLSGSNTPSRAGSLITGEEPTENLIRVSHTPDKAELKTEDGALAVEVDRGDGVLTYRIRNIGSAPVRDLQLSVYANLEANHTEMDDHGWLDASRGALIVSDSSGAACALASDIPPSAGWCGVWGNTIQRMVENQAIPVSQWSSEEDKITSVLSKESEDVLLTQEGERHSGCTLLAPHEDGALVEPAYPSHGAIALEQSVTIPPGESRQIRFILAWYYPNALDSDGKFVGHQYAHWFGNSKEVALYAAKHWENLARRTGEWQEKIYDDPHLPNGLKDQLVNSLYSLARNTCWLYDGRFSHSESFIGCPITETIVCRFYGSFATALLFPDLERNTMRQFMHWQRSDGAIPFAFGQGERWSSPYYDTQKILDSAEFVLMAWRDYTFWKDTAWAKEVFPAVQRALRYATSLNKPGENLPNDDLSMQYYDCWQFHGVSAYTGGVYLAALKAGAAFGALLNDQSFERECAHQFKLSQASFEKRLWTGSYYRLWEDDTTGRKSDTCLAAQLTGQWYASLCGLGDILPRGHMLTALRHIAKVNGGGKVWALLNGVLPDGSRDHTGTNGQSDTATLGETWCYVATCYWLGKPNLGLPFVKRLCEDIALRQRDDWGTSWNMDSDTGAMLWGGEYYSDMCVWSLWLAMK
jgi:uncharacterized protein (DUF608 family)